MVRSLPVLATCLVLAFAAATPASAGTRSAAFGVAARVVARTWIEPVDEPASILITRDDLEQGYKLVDVRYRVYTAGTPRYLLNITPLTGLADRIHIAGLRSPVSLDSTDITVLQQAAAAVDELRLRLRVELRAGLPAGTYALPVRVSVSAS